VINPGLLHTGHGHTPTDKGHVPIFKDTRYYIIPSSHGQLIDLAPSLFLFKYTHTHTHTHTPHTPLDKQYNSGGIIGGVVAIVVAIVVVICVSVCVTTAVIQKRNKQCKYKALSQLGDYMYMYMGACNAV
jgi:hypothetical protein